MILRRASWALTEFFRLQLYEHEKTITCFRFPRASVLYPQTSFVFFIIIHTLFNSPPHRWALDQDTFYGKTEHIARIIRNMADRKT